MTWERNKWKQLKRTEVKLKSKWIKKIKSKTIKTTSRGGGNWPTFSLSRIHLNSNIITETKFSWCVFVTFRQRIRVGQTILFKLKLPRQQQKKKKKTVTAIINLDMVLINCVNPSLCEKVWMKGRFFRLIIIFKNEVFLDGKIQMKDVFFLFGI